MLSKSHQLAVRSACAAQQERACTTCYRGDSLTLDGHHRERCFAQAREPDPQTCRPCDIRGSRPSWRRCRPAVGVGSPRAERGPHAGWSAAFRGPRRVEGIRRAWPAPRMKCRAAGSSATQSASAQRAIRSCASASSTSTSAKSPGRRCRPSRMRTTPSISGASALERATTPSASTWSTSTRRR